MNYTKKKINQIENLQYCYLEAVRENDTLKQTHEQELIAASKDVYELHNQITLMQNEGVAKIQEEVKKETERIIGAIKKENMELFEKVGSLELRLSNSEASLKSEENRKKELLDANSNLQMQLKIALELADPKHKVILERATLEEDFYEKIIKSTELLKKQGSDKPSDHVMIDPRELALMKEKIQDLTTHLEQETNQNEVLQMRILELEKQKNTNSNFNTPQMTSQVQRYNSVFLQADCIETSPTFPKEQDNSEIDKILNIGSKDEEKFRSNLIFKGYVSNQMDVWHDVLYIRPGKERSSDPSEVESLVSKIQDLESAISIEKNKYNSEQKHRVDLESKYKLSNDQITQLEGSLNKLREESNSKSIQISCLQSKLTEVKKRLSENENKDLTQIITFIDEKDNLSSQIKEDIHELYENSKRQIEKLEKDIEFIRGIELEKLKDKNRELEERLRATSSLLNSKVVQNEMLINKVDSLEKSIRNTDSPNKKSSPYVLLPESKLIQTSSLEMLSTEEIPHIHSHSVTNPPSAITESLVGFHSPIVIDNLYKPKTAPEMEEKSPSMISGVQIERVNTLEPLPQGHIDFFGLHQMIADEDEVRPVAISEKGFINLKEIKPVPMFNPNVLEFSGIPSESLKNESEESRKPLTELLPSHHDRQQLDSFAEKKNTNNMLESGVISSAKDSDQHKMDYTLNKNFSNTLPMEESGVISSAKDSDQHKMDYALKVQQINCSPMEESGIIASVKDNDQDKMDQIFETNRGQHNNMIKQSASFDPFNKAEQLVLDQYMNQNKNQPAKLNSSFIDDTKEIRIPEHHQEKNQQIINYLRSKVKDLETKLSLQDSMLNLGKGSDTPKSLSLNHSPFSYKSNQQQKDMLEKYSNYLSSPNIRINSERGINNIKQIIKPKLISQNSLGISNFSQNDRMKFTDNPSSVLMKKNNVQFEDASQPGRAPLKMMPDTEFSLFGPNGNSNDQTELERTKTITSVELADQEITSKEKSEYSSRSPTDRYSIRVQPAYNTNEPIPEVQSSYEAQSPDKFGNLSGFSVKKFNRTDVSRPAITTSQLRSEVRNQHGRRVH